VTCPSCGLVLPPVARFCARCGTRLVPEAAAPPDAMAPVWLLALLWVGSAGLLSVAVFYGAIATGLVQPSQIDPTVDTSQVQPTAALIAVCAGSLSAAHGAAAIGLMASLADVLVNLLAGAEPLLFSRRQRRNRLSRAWFSRPFDSCQ